MDDDDYFCFKHALEDEWSKSCVGFEMVNCYGLNMCE